MVRGLAVVGLAMVLAAPPAMARDDSMPLEDSPPGVGAQLGFGLASVGLNLVYMPAKMLYAVAGGLVGLMAWGVTAGNTDVAMGIFHPAFGGTWAVTPEMLEGRDPILFNGPSYDPGR
jgi:hypothetical protein